MSEVERLLRGLPADWRATLGDRLEGDWLEPLADFVAAERASGEVYPPEDQVFAALQLTPFERVRVVLLGQDPYHGAGQAHGLAFSVVPGHPRPPSLRNVHTELHEDLGLTIPTHGSLEAWAHRGVLLLNTVLTVRAGEAGSHARKGWEKLTDAIIEALSARETPVVFLLWGAPARKKRRLIDTERHPIVESPHPSPLSAHRGFFGSRPFSAVNQALMGLGQRPLDWSLPGRRAPERTITRVD